MDGDEKLMRRTDFSRKAVSGLACKGIADKDTRMVCEELSDLINFVDDLEENQHRLAVGQKRNDERIDFLEKEAAIPKIEDTIDRLVNRKFADPTLRRRMRALQMEIMSELIEKEAEMEMR